MAQSVFDMPGFTPDPHPRPQSVFDMTAPQVKSDSADVDPEPADPEPEPADPPAQTQKKPARARTADEGAKP